jgi:Protein of unknown function (DUF2950)
VDGKMTGGFAILAYPAAYRNSGIMTFIVSDDGTIYQKDLGEKTFDLAVAHCRVQPWGRLERREGDGGSTQQVKSNAVRLNSPAAAATGLSAATTPRKTVDSKLVNRRVSGGSRASVQGWSFASRSSRISSLKISAHSGKRVRYFVGS